jgi:Na+/proline symporter
MSALQILLLMGGYFLVILGISWWTSRREKTSLKEYFLAGKSVPWWLVAFGMIGNSLSGVTFISVPGQVGAKGMIYMQTVMGYVLGYAVIAFVLLPLYYRLNLTTIYTFLKIRLGKWPYKTAASFFLVSRLLGAAARLYLVTGVLQVFVFGQWGIPLPVTAAIALMLILLYTVEGGMKTLVWTDTLQSLFLVSAVMITVVLLGQELGGNPIALAMESSHSKLFDWDSSHANYFWKDLLGGMFITITMTGLDQDQMQKNLICKNIREAQKNMVSFSLIVLVVNFFFLTLGALLFVYAEQHSLTLPTRADHTYPFLALNTFSADIPLLGVLFMLGLTAAAFSSADGALTALTTSFMIDLADKSPEDEGNTRYKRWTHLSMAVVAYLSILIFFGWDEYNRLHGGTGLNIIDVVLRLATYTYGPLLGLYCFGLFTRLEVRGGWTPLIAVLSPLACLWINLATGNWLGFMTLPLNGLLTFIGLLLSAHWSSAKTRQPD